MELLSTSIGDTALGGAGTSVTKEKSQLIIVETRKARLVQYLEVGIPPVPIPFRHLVHSYFHSSPMAILRPPSFPCYFLEFKYIHNPDNPTLSVPEKKKKKKLPSICICDIVL